MNKRAAEGGSRTGARSEPGVDRSDAREALLQAVEWRLLGLLFERPREGWFEEITALAPEVHDAVLQRAAVEAGAANAGIYLDVLGPGGPVSPREVAYRGRHDPGQILADVGAFYEAFAFRPQAEDPPDHVAVEAGFAGWLRLKESYARSRGDAEAARTCVEAFDHFVTEHLRTYAEPLCHRLESAPVAHLALAAQALAARTGPAPVLPEDAPSEDPEAAFPGCDGCPDLACADRPIEP